MANNEKPRDINELLEFPEFQKLLTDYKAMLDDGFYILAHKLGCTPVEARDLMSGFVRSELVKLEEVNKSLKKS